MGNGDYNINDLIGHVWKKLKNITSRGMFLNINIMVKLSNSNLEVKIRKIFQNLVIIAFVLIYCEWKKTLSTSVLSKATKKWESYHSSWEIGGRSLNSRPDCSTKWVSGQPVLDRETRFHLPLLKCSIFNNGCLCARCTIVRITFALENSNYKIRLFL